MQASSYGDCLIYFCLLLPLVISFSIIAPVRAICLVLIIIIPQMSEHSLVSLTVPRSPVNKFLSIDQILVTFPLTDDTYPRGLFCLCSSPICSLHSEETGFFSFFDFLLIPSQLSLPSRPSFSMFPDFTHHIFFFSFIHRILSDKRYLGGQLSIICSHKHVHNHRPPPN